MTRAMRLGALATNRVEVAPHGCQVGHVAAQHAIECAPATESLVRSFDPAVGLLRRLEQNLQRLVDAEHVAHAADRVVGHTRNSTLLPLVECGAGRTAEQ